MLIIGCGDVGRRVARQYTGQAVAVRGVVRGESAAQALRAAGVQPLRADLDREPLPPLRAGGEQVFYFAPPPNQGTEDPRVARVLRMFEREGAPARIVYISTTGVYGDCAGAWVDEGRPVNPGADRARRRLDAENRFQAFCRDSGTQLVILRVAGIYGPDRLPLNRIRQGLPLVRQEEAPFTNRVHEQDLVQVCLAAMRQPVAGEVFNVSDGHPGTMAEYFDAVADRAGLPRPPKIGMAEAARRLSPGMLSYMRESRRLDSTKMRRLLLPTLSFDSLEQGLADCFPAAEPSPR